MPAKRLLFFVLLTHLASSHAATPACADYIALAGNWTPCYGAAVLTSAAFRQYGDVAPGFSTTASSSSGALPQLASSFFPATFFPNQSVNIVGDRSAGASVSGGYLGESMFAQAHGDLAAGSMKIYTTSTVSGPRKESRIDYLSSVAVLRDQITVVIPKTAASFDVGISMRIEGSKTSLSPQESSGVQAQFQVLSLGGHQLAYDGAQYRQPGLTNAVLDGSFQVPGMVEVGDNLVGTFDIISLMFTMLPEPGDTLDFGNSAYLSLALPPGATYSSASGSFLVSAVPEPVSLMSLLLGLGVLAAYRRRSAG